MTELGREGGTERFCVCACVCKRESASVCMRVRERRVVSRRSKYAGQTLFWSAFW